MTQPHHIPYQDKTDPWSSHGRIVHMLETFPPKTNVLDIGIASGTIPRLSKPLNLTFYGIEPNPYYVKICKPYYHKIYPTSVENFDLKNLKKYQVIIMADVIEHLVDPKNTLTKLVNNSLPDTNFIISVPNIANVWTRLQLLSGNWNYSSNGLLDSTHLRFFTKKTTIDLISASGLTIIQSYVTPIPLNLIHPVFSTKPGKILHNFLAHLTNLSDTLLGYQFVTLLKKK